MFTEARWRARALGFALLTLLGAAGLAGCPGTLDDKQRFLTGGGGPCPDVPQMFSLKCGGGPCHGPNKPQEGLDLESPKLAARVVGWPASSCLGILADPENPEDSVLYTKLLELPDCGEQMPFGTDPLSDHEIACVRDWIAEQEPALPDAGTDAGDDGGDAGDDGG